MALASDLLTRIQAFLNRTNNTAKTLPTENRRWAAADIIDTANAIITLNDDVTTLAVDVDAAAASAAAASAAAATKLPTNGGTMTGPLILATFTDLDNEAISKTTLENRLAANVELDSVALPEGAIPTVTGGMFLTDSGITQADLEGLLAGGGGGGSENFGVIVDVQVPLDSNTTSLVIYTVPSGKVVSPVHVQLAPVVGNNYDDVLSFSLTARFTGASSDTTIIGTTTGIGLTAFNPAAPSTARRGRRVDISTTSQPELIVDETFKLTVTPGGLMAPGTVCRFRIYAYITDAYA